MKNTVFFPIKNLDYTLVADITVTGFRASIIVPVVVFLLLDMVT